MTTLHCVAFEHDKELNPDLVHGILVTGYGHDARLGNATCCGLVRSTLKAQRTVVRDGDPISCQDCLTSLVTTPIPQLEEDTHA